MIVVTGWSVTAWIAVDDRAAPAGLLRVDQHTPVVAHQCQRVAAAAREDVEDVADVQRLHPHDLVALCGQLGRGRLLETDACGQQPSTG